jgi:F-type H+-transporting ATPase subunit b
MELVTPGLGLMFWMILVFAIVIFILKKFAWVPILTALHEREKTIDSALKTAERAKEEMAKLQASNEKILAEAHMERDKLIKEARVIKDKIVDEAKVQAQSEAQKIVDAARKSIENEKKAAIKEIKDQVAELSILVAEKILKEKLSDTANQDDYIDRLIKDIKSN